jgi:hypothetical protein
MLSRTQISPYFKISKLPRGPTLTFRVLNYTLSRDILSSLRKQVKYQRERDYIVLAHLYDLESRHIRLFCVGLIYT